MTIFKANLLGFDMDYKQVFHPRNRKSEFKFDVFVYLACITILIHVSCLVEIPIVCASLLRIVSENIQLCTSLLFCIFFHNAIRIQNDDGGTRKSLDYV